MRFTLVVLFFIVLMSNLYGTELYVAPEGKDANAGSISAPLATFAAARDKADQLKTGSTPVTVYFRAGTYYLSAPVVFGPTNSGTAAAPITYTSYGSETAVISGGVKVTSAWTTYSGNIMVTTLSQNLKVDQLFLNGRRQILARYPNCDTSKHVLDGSASDCIGAAHVDKWTDPAQGPGYIRALHNARWGGNSFIITGKSGSTVTTKWVGDNNRGSGMNTSYRMVENIFEELDAPGEWYYNKTNGKLYFYPPSGANLGTATIELASLDELVRLVGASASKVQYINFKGLTFTHTYRTLFSKPYEKILRGDWCIARAGTIFMQDAENIRVECSTFDQVGGNGVFMSGYNRNNVVFNNTFNEGGASCVILAGLLSSVRCPQNWETTGCSDYTTPGPLTQDYPANITIDNNLMYYFGRFEKQSAGVDLTITQLDTVRHNTIYRCPRAGINMTDGCWGGDLIEYNHVYKTVLETSDHGPFNAWMRDRHYDNLNNTAYAKLDVVNPIIIRFNKLETDPDMFGIDLDDGSSNVNAYNNLLVGVGTKFQQGQYNYATNNVIVAGGVVDMHHLLGNRDYIFAHNIVVGQTDVYSISGDNVSGQYSPTDLYKKMKQCDSNCIWANGKSPTVCPWQSRGTLWCSWQTWLAGGMDAHSVVADPMFVDPANGDYSVKAGSPALLLGFKNFDMKSFGRLLLPCGTSSSISNPGVKNIPETGEIGFHCNFGILSISYPQNYHVSITSPLGRKIAAFTGKGRVVLDLAKKNAGGGVYIVTIRTDNKTFTNRILVTR